VDSTPLTVQDLLDQEFSIHILNNYSYVGLTSYVDHFGLSADQVRTLVRVEHHHLVSQLASQGIQYAELRPALVPRADRFETAYILDSTRIEDGNYGRAYAERWIPAIKAHGPAKSVLRVGDILRLPRAYVWQQLDQRLVGPRPIPALYTEQYFAVYMTNMSAAQVQAVHDELAATTEGYLGYVDCTTWNPLKAGMFLPQVGLRFGNRIITDADDGGTANQVGYPYEESGFQVVGIDQSLHGLFLSHRIDNGIPEWADTDSAVSFAVLGGNRLAATSTRVVIDEGRIGHLEAKHRASLVRARMEGLDAETLASAIEDKFENGLIYNLRFRFGTRGGVPAPELDALMYSVQVEFLDDSGDARRYQIGLKYSPADHTSEVVTFY